MQDLSQVMRETRSLMGSLPRQLHYMLRKVNSPDYAARVKIQELNEIRKSMELSFNLLFLGLIIGSLVLSGTLIFINISQDNIAGFPSLSITFYALAIILGVVAFINYIKK
jgi:ubiquinone biosynthesis protein